MKILQINNVVNSGSTGRIAEEIGNVLIDHGHESFIAHGSYAAHKGKKTLSKSKLIKIGTEFDAYYHGIYTLLTDKHGLASVKATRKLVKKINYINPDVIGLHNIHGYYINYEILFEFIKRNKIPVLWTFHDCWPFTGHCAYYDGVDCKKWKTHCNNCPLSNFYPKSFKDRSFYNFIDKKKSFKGVDQLKIITPSHWLAKEVKASFLKDYPVEVIHNGINLNIFRPEVQNFKSDEKIVLGVASIWDRRKGLKDFISLRSYLPESYNIVLIGLNEKQIKALPEGITGISRTENIEALVQWYNQATVFVNPTYIDNFPTTNIEALACGTPVISYNTGGSPEAFDGKTGMVVEKGNVKQLSECIKTTIKDKSVIANCRNRAEAMFDSKKRFLDYLKLYTNFKA